MITRLCIVLVSLTLSNLVYFTQAKAEAQAEVGLGTATGPETKPETKLATPPTDVAGAGLGFFDGTATRRSQNRTVITAIYSPADLIIPGKKGLSLGWLQSAASTWEFEYLTASLSAPFLIQDLGEISDTRMTLMRRSFADRNSFNYFYGLTYFNLNVHVGNQILSAISGATSADLVGIRALGLVWGIGHRWTFPYNVTAGIDWFSWSQPIYVLERDDAIKQFLNNQADRDHVETALRVGSYMPRIALAKIQIGMSF